MKQERASGTFSTAARRCRRYMIIQICLFVCVLSAQFTNQYSLTDLFVWSCVLINFVFIVICRKTGGRPPCPVFAALFLTLGADTLLVLLDTQYLCGVILFCCVQVSYALYLEGRRKQYLWSDTDFGGRGHVHSGPAIRVIVPAAAILLLLGCGMLSPLSGAAVFSYSRLLLNTVLAFLAAKKSRSQNDRLFAIGLLLFLGCDTCVGIRNSLLPAGIRDAAYMLNWIFYVPSQFLITLSFLREYTPSSST